ncbi:MAG: RsiW-degrading membrane proteinase PrsW (M82 family) [Crocinitomicaceae bacterium]
MQNFVAEPELSTAEEKIAFHAKHGDFLYLTAVYDELLEENPEDLALNFEFVSTVTDYIDVQNRYNTYDVSELERSPWSERIISRYTDSVNRKSDKRKDIGNIFLALHYTDLKDYSRATILLDSVSDQSASYYQYTKGKNLFRQYEYECKAEAEKMLLEATSSSEPVVEAYSELARLYYYFREEQKLDELVNNSEAYEHLHLFPKRIAFMRSASYSSYWHAVFQNEISTINPCGLIAATLILLIWLFYLRKVDMYEKEKWVHVLATIFMSMCTVFLVYPFGDLLTDVVHYYPSDDPGVGFIHMVVSIGMVEEFVKIIPVLIILRFTKAINEPFDYILYCSLSALGFAFIENIGYLDESSLARINGRGLTATVAHIVFSSTIGYGLMLAKYKRFKTSIFIFILSFIIASAMHGFYDFWIIHEWGQDYHWVAIIFLLLCIHIWHLYANNTLNISTFYDPKVKLQNNKLKYYLILSLIGLVMFSYVVSALTRGPLYGADFLELSLLNYGFLILYLAFSFSRFEIVRGYLAPISIPFHFLIPRIKRQTDFSGLPLKIYATRSLRFIDDYQDLNVQLNSNAKLLRRIVVENNLESYSVKLDNPISIDGFRTDELVIMPKSEKKTLNNTGSILVSIMLIPLDLELENAVLAEDDLIFAGWAISKKDALIGEESRLV